MVSMWDAHVDRWLDGDDSLQEPLDAWWRSYAGKGAGAPTRNAFPEPFVGSFDRPKLVMLGLNPGVAVPELQGIAGDFSNAIRDTSYSRWAAGDPYGSAAWTNLRGKNTYRAARLRFAERWLGEEVEGNELLTVELYPWHSEKVTASLRPPDDVLEPLIWAPLAALPVPELFAFGAPWAQVLGRLGMEPIEHLGRGGKDWGSKVASRTVLTYETPAERRLIVIWQSGYAGPPGPEDTARLRDALT